MSETATSIPSDNKNITTAKPEGLKRKGKARKITLEDAEQLAEMVIKYRMNESEAAYALGLTPVQWFTFKDRKKSRAEFDAMLTRIRGAQIRNCVESIDQAGNDREFTTINKAGQEVTITKPGDWRAKAWIAERVLSPDRFNDKRNEQPVVNIGICAGIDLDSIAARIYGGKQAKVIEGQEVKQLPEKAE